MFVILAGGGARGELRFGVKRLPLRRHDIITLRVPPARLDEIKRAVEQAWVAFRTGFHPTDDANKIGDTLREQALK